MPRGSNEVIVIMWRDIPAQVNAQLGRERKQVQLPEKFQRAIDRAKRKAHIYTAEEDIAQWRRLSLPLNGDLTEAAQREADRLEVSTLVSVSANSHMPVVLKLMSTKQTSRTKTCWISKS